MVSLKNIFLSILVLITHSIYTSGYENAIKFFEANQNARNEEVQTHLNAIGFTFDFLNHTDKCLLITHFDWNRVKDCNNPEDECGELEFRVIKNPEEHPDCWKKDKHFYYFAGSPRLCRSLEEYLGDMARPWFRVSNEWPWPLTRNDSETALIRFINTHESDDSIISLIAQSKNLKIRSGDTFTGLTALAYAILREKTTISLHLAAAGTEIDVLKQTLKQIYNMYQNYLESAKQTPDVDPRDTH